MCKPGVEALNAVLWTSYAPAARVPTTTILSRNTDGSMGGFRPPVTSSSESSTSKNE